jgi:hypothetical protein
MAIKSRYQIIIDGESSDIDTAFVNSIYCTAKNHNLKVVEFKSSTDDTILPRLLSISDAKEYLNMGINGVYELCKDADFPVIKIGHKKFIDRDKLDELISSGKFTLKHEDKRIEWLLNYKLNNGYK